MKEPTSEQMRVISVMRQYKALTGELPSLTYIYKSLGYSHKSSAQYHVKSLKDNGFWKLLETPNETVNIPLVGNISCGPAILAEENIEGYIPIDVSKLKKKSSKYFFLRADGDSMNKENINTGDFVLIRQEPTAAVNQIVVALVGDDATLKKLQKSEDGVPILQPCSTNPIHKPRFMLEDFSILGVMERVISPKQGAIV